jgi:hypothetical protein
VGLRGVCVLEVDRSENSSLTSPDDLQL